MQHSHQNRLEYYFNEYSHYHTTKGNKLTHYFGIPFIIVGLLGLLGRVTLGPQNAHLYFRLDAGTLLLIGISLWYLYLDWKLASGFSLMLVGLYFLGRCLSIPINIILFIIGWILQGMGHALFEHKSPAFIRNFVHLLIGPLWIFAILVGYRTRESS